MLALFKNSLKGTNASGAEEEEGNENEVKEVMDLMV